MLGSGKDSMDAWDKESAKPISNKEALDFIRREISHEYSLLNSRITWFLLCETFLVAGFAALLNIKHNWDTNSLSVIFQMAGLVLTIPAFLSIWAARRTINIWRNSQHNLFRDIEASKELKKITTDRNKMPPTYDFIHKISAILSYSLPIILAFCWIMTFYFSV